MSASLTAQSVLAEFKKCGITHVICLPGTELKFIFDALTEQTEITMVPVCREGEAVGVATGLTLGGKHPVVMHQNTGIFESGDSIRGLGIEYQLPLLMIIGYNGWLHGVPLTNAAAYYTEPVLDALGIRHYLVENEDDADKISAGYQETQNTRKPVAILIGRG